MVTPALIAAAVAHVEGFFYPTSLAWWHKNPGNLRNDDGTFKTFLTIEDGWHALMVEILDNRHFSLRAYLSARAPNTGRDPQAYVTEVCKVTGYTPGTMMEFS